MAKIHHWKHGWIPLDATVAPPKRKTASTKSLLNKNYSDMTPAEKIRAAEIMYGKGTPKAAAARRKFAPKSGDKLDAATKAYSANRGAARLKAAGIAKRVEVDGVTFDTYERGQDPLGLDASSNHPHDFTPTQQKEIAGVVNEVLSRFPAAKPIRIVGDDDTERLGVTDWDGRRITLSKRMWDRDTVLGMHDNFGANGAIAAAYATSVNPRFRKAVIAHEIGHALQMQNPDARTVGEARAFERESWDDVRARGGTTPMQRYEFDHLPVGNHEQTIYGTENQYEWFAEAFADGYLHGPKASESGKWAVSMLHEIYGGQQ